MKTPARQQGVGLMEILVSILVLSIGILGMVALLLSSVRTSHESFYQSRAMYLANSISDRIRANSAAALDGKYVLARTTSKTTISKDCASEACSATELAAYDLAQWRNSANGSDLPSAAVSIATQDNHSLHTITIMWDPTRQGVAGTACRANNATDKTCLQLMVQL